MKYAEPGTPPKPASRQRSPWRLLILGGLLPLILGGCALPGALYSSIKYPVGIEFFDAKSGQAHFVPSEGLLKRETLVTIGEDQKSCLTLQQDGDALVARLRAFDGRMLKEQRLPLLTEFYCSENGIAATPDLRQLAFYDYPSKEIVLYDLASDQRKTLLPRAGSTGFTIGFMQFAQNDRLLVVVNRDKGLGRDVCELLSIDTGAGRATSLMQLTRVFLHVSDVVVSPAKHMVALTDADAPYRMPQTIRIYDLDTQRQIAAIRDPDAGYISCFCLSADAQTVAWIRNTREGLALMVAPVSGGSPRLVRHYPAKTLGLHLNFLDEQTVALTTWQTSPASPTKRLVAVDLVSGEERLVAEKAFNGKVLIAGERPTIVCVMGY